MPKNAKQRYASARKAALDFVGAFDGIEYALVRSSFLTVMRKFEQLTPLDIERGKLTEIRKEVESTPRIDPRSRRLFNKQA